LGGRLARIAAEMVGCAESGPRPGEEASGSVVRPGLTSGWGGEVGEGFGGGAARRRGGMGPQGGVQWSRKRFSAVGLGIGEATNRTLGCRAPWFIFCKKKRNFLFTLSKINK